MEVQRYVHRQRWILDRPAAKRYGRPWYIEAPSRKAMRRAKRQRKDAWPENYYVATASNIWGLLGYKPGIHFINRRVKRK